MSKLSYRIINAITVYRIIAAPVLIFLIFKDLINPFKWLLLVSFFTDFIDGYLARKFKVTSILGTRLDSIGDDLTVLAAFVGLLVFKTDFFYAHIYIFILLFTLFVIQVVASLIRYGKITSFHTYLAKAAAILQGVFFILMFLLPQPVMILFYAASAVTFCELIEEIFMVFVLPEWEANLKGLYWVMKKNKST